MTGPLADVQGRIRTMEARLAAIGQEITAAEALEIDESDVARALEAFDPVWASLWPAERARILALLVEGIDYGGRDGITLRLRAGGIQSVSRPEPA